MKINSKPTVQRPAQSPSAKTEAKAPATAAARQAVDKGATRGTDPDLDPAALSRRFTSSAGEARPLPSAGSPSSVTQAGPQPKRGLADGVNPDMNASNPWVALGDYVANLMATTKPGQIRNIRGDAPPAPVTNDPNAGPR